ncbi:hypothetical protein GQ457_09G001490 [Hibiscus cannabinus]
MVHNIPLGKMEHPRGYFDQSLAADPVVSGGSIQKIFKFPITSLASSPTANATKLTSLFRKLICTCSALVFKLWEFIFEELKKKYDVVFSTGNASALFSTRGEYALTCRETNRDRSNVLKYVTEFTYDESIPTDICYHTETDKAELKYGSESLKHRQLCKILSDYNVVSSSPNQDEKACEEILSSNTIVEPMKMNGDQSNSVLFDAGMLVTELKRMEMEDKWMLMSRVWVELLCYTAGHCKATAHATQLSRVCLLFDSAADEVGVHITIKHRSFQTEKPMYNSNFETFILSEQ